MQGPGGARPTLCSFFMVDHDMLLSVDLLCHRAQESSGFGDIFPSCFLDKILKFTLLHVIFLHTLVYTWVLCLCVCRGVHIHMYVHVF